MDQNNRRYNILSGFPRRFADWIQMQFESMRRYPVIRIVDRYLIREFSKSLFAVIALFYVLGVVIVLFDEIDTFLEYGASFSSAMMLVLLASPHRLAEGGPLVMLLAAVFGIGRMVYAREIDAMVIGGYRFWRLLMPLVVFSSICALGYFLACEYIISPCRAKAEDLMDLTIKAEDSERVGRKRVWMHGQNRRKYYVRFYEPDTATLYGVHIIELDDHEFRLARRIEARTGHWDASSGVWVLRNGGEWTYSPDGDVEHELFDERSYLLEEGPEDFSLVSQDEETLNHGDLAHLVRVIRQAGGDPVAYLPYLRLREAMPFSLILMALLGLALAIRTGRGGYVLGLGISLIVAIGFYAVLLFCLSCAKKGILPAWIAAWLPNLLLLAVVTWFLRKLGQAA